jgi:hypothetical protein
MSTQLTQYKQTINAIFAFVVGSGDVYRHIGFPFLASIVSSCPQWRDGVAYTKFIVNGNTSFKCISEIEWSIIIRKGDILHFVIHYLSAFFLLRIWGL